MKPRKPSSKFCTKKNKNQKNKNGNNKLDKALNDTFPASDPITKY